jgi:hypothetical protein
MTTKDINSNYLSKPEISFWIPIIVYTVMIASSSMLLSNKIDLLTQKVEIFQRDLTAQENRMSVLATSVNNYIGTLRAHIGQ